MSFPRYAEYKDSGVEWLGEVPGHWEVKRLKRCFDLITEKSDNRVNPVALENIESWSGRFIISETEFQGEGVSFNIGDILFGKLRPYLAKALLAGRSGEAVGDFHVLRPKSKLHGRFGLYQILNREFISIIDGSTFGAKMPRASWDFMAKMPLAMPPEAEQSTVGIFLDRETRKIDALVAEQERLIALLREKRQAVISQAVMRGLDSSTLMRNSSIEWLGEVPEHWEVVPLKRVLAFIESGTSVNATDTSATDNEYGVLKTSCVYCGEFDIEENKAVVPEEYDRVSCLLRLNALIVSRMNTPGLVGAAGLVRKSRNGLFLPDRLWQIIFTEAQPAFAHYWTQTVSYRSQVQMACSGTSASMQNLSQDQFRCFAFPNPPLVEQLAIVSFLDQETNKLDALVTEAQRAIDLLKERRSALISAAVTGKIDVRQFVEQAQPSADLVPA